MECEGQLHLDYIDKSLLYLGEMNLIGHRHGKGLNKNVHGHYRTYGVYKNGKAHGWFKRYWGKKLYYRGYAINGEPFFHFVVPEDDGSVEYY